MQYSTYINNLFVASHPACDDLDFIDVAIFDCVRKLIAQNANGKPWGNRKLVDGILWSDIRIVKIQEEMPLLRVNRKPMSKEAIRKRVARICESGLLQRDPNNKFANTAYIALGPLAEDYDSYKEPRSNSTVTLVEFNQPLGKIPPTPRLNFTNNKNTLIQTTLSNSLPPDSQANGDKQPKVKKRITYNQAVDFYENEIRSFGLEDPSPLPEPLAARRAALRESYRRCFAWMRDGDDENPGGLRSEVMTMGIQLSFKQFLLLVDERKLTGFQIKHYLIRLENFTENKNKSIYHTIGKWHDMDKERGSVPPREPNKPSTGLSMPNRVHQ